MIRISAAAIDTLNNLAGVGMTRTVRVAPIDAVYTLPISSANASDAADVDHVLLQFQFNSSEMWTISRNAVGDIRFARRGTAARTYTDVGTFVAGDAVEDMRLVRVVAGVVGVDVEDEDTDVASLANFDDLIPLVQADIVSGIVRPYWACDPVAPALLSGERLERHQYESSRAAGEHEAVAAARQHIKRAGSRTDIVPLGYAPVKSNQVLPVFGATCFGYDEIWLANDTGAAGFIAAEAQADDIYSAQILGGDGNMPGYRRTSQTFLEDRDIRAMVHELFDLGGDIQPGRHHARLQRL